MPEIARLGVRKAAYYHIAIFELAGKQRRLYLTRIGKRGLKNDKHAIFTTAAKAQEAVDWMTKKTGIELAEAAA